MANQVNIGIIGTSWWADLMYLPVLQDYERANLIAICGRNRERGNAMAAKFTIPEVYTDYHQMIEKANIDAVVVATPDDLHYEMVMAALDAGKHVLCEKPVANNGDHAREMLEKAEAVGVKHMVLFTWHWLPNIQRLKQLLDEGYTGAIYNGYIQWFTNGGRDSAYNWIYDANRSNGTLGTVGSHMIHMAMWLLGDVTAVIGQLGFHIQRENMNSDISSNPANDMAGFIMEFASGAYIQVLLSGVAHTFGNGNQLAARFHGEKGTLLTDFGLSLNIPFITRGQRDGTDDILTESGNIDTMAHYLSQPVGARYFVDCILDDKHCTPSLLEGYKVQQVIDAVMQSHESGCRVVVGQ